MKSKDRGFATEALPNFDLGPFKKAKVAEKVGAGGLIGLISVAAGLAGAGAIAGSNSDMEPMTQNAIAGLITAAVAGILSGTVNCVKNWWRRRFNK